MTTRALTPGPRDERGVMSARILAAARTQFAENGWAGTTIRAVARDADVDPALVYHYFGTKEGLLDAATTPPQKWLDTVAETWSSPAPELGRRILQALMASWVDEETGPVLQAIIQTAAHDAATREKLRTTLQNQLIGRSTLGDSEQQRLLRAGLILSQGIGFALMRYVWKVEPVASMSDEEALDAIAPNLQRYIDGDLA